MTPEELKQVYDNLKQEGKSDEDIVAGLGKLYEDGEIEKDELKAFIEPLGYEFTPEFDAMSDDEAPTDPKKAKEGVTDAEIEASEDEGQDNPSPASETTSSKESDDDSTDDDERKRAFSAMGLD